MAVEIAPYRYRRYMVMVGPKHNSPDCSPPPICILKRAVEWVAHCGSSDQEVNQFCLAGGGEIYCYFRGGVNPKS